MFYFFWSFFKVFTSRFYFTIKFSLLSFHISRMVFKLMRTMTMHICGCKNGSKVHVSAYILSIISVFANTIISSLIKIKSWLSKSLRLCEKTTYNLCFWIMVLFSLPLNILVVRRSKKTMSYFIFQFL